MELKTHIGDKGLKNQSIVLLCDWPERKHPTPTQFQRRRVCLIELNERNQHLGNLKGNGYICTSTPPLANQ